MPETKTLSINIVSHNHRSFVSSIELFKNILPYSSSYYTKWLKLNVTEQPQNLPKKGRDYIYGFDVKGYMKHEKRPGPKLTVLLLSVQFARELCYQTKTLPAEEVREFLYQFVDK